jgi:hypothetical protein
MAISNPSSVSVADTKQCVARPCGVGHLVDCSASFSMHIVTVFQVRPADSRSANIRRWLSLPEALHDLNSPRPLFWNQIGGCQGTIGLLITEVSHYGRQCAHTLGHMPIRVAQHSKADYGCPSSYAYHVHM